MGLREKGVGGRPLMVLVSVMESIIQRRNLNDMSILCMYGADGPTFQVYFATLRLHLPPYFFFSFGIWEDLPLTAKKLLLPHLRGRDRRASEDHQGFVLWRAAARRMVQGEDRSPSPAALFPRLSYLRKRSRQTGVTTGVSRRWFRGKGNKKSGPAII